MREEAEVTGRKKKFERLRRKKLPRRVTLLLESEISFWGVFWSFEEQAAEVRLCRLVYFSLVRTDPTRG